MPHQPNILLLIPDGMQGRVTAPEHICRAPHFDRVAARGVRFTRAYTPTPTCSPARASLMTGLLAHSHGVLQVEHCVDADQCVLRTDRPHWAQRLADAGYRTGYFGKWHIERTQRVEDFGWQVNGSHKSDMFRETGLRGGDSEQANLDPALTGYQTGPEGYDPILHYGVTDLLPAQRSVSLPADLALRFLDDALTGDQPWCCCVSYPIPNEAMICSRETFDLYDVDAIDLPPNLHDEFRERPNLYRRQKQLWADITEEEWRMARACYYARVTEIDQQLGRLLDRIDAAGRPDDTVVILTSDHGKYVGGHGFEAHNFGAFEEIYNIPMIVSGPGIIRGAVTDARVGLHDLCPTILELTGAEQIDVPDSRSFAPALRDPAGAEANFATGYAEYHGTRFPLMQRVYWDGPWKFVFNGFDFDELYNLDEDPYEMRNLAVEPLHQERIRSMMKAIWRRIEETNDTALSYTHYYSLRFAAVGPK